MKTLTLLAEKIAWTFVQVFLVTFAAADTIGADTAQAAIVAAVGAVLTIVANGLPVVPAGLTFLEDSVWRVLRTFAVSFASYLIAAPRLVLDVDTMRAAVLAGITAAVVVVKSIAAQRVGAPSSAATLPRSQDASA